MKIFRPVLVLLVVLILALLIVPFALAQSPTPPTDVPTWVQATLELFSSLVGWPLALGAALAIALKLNWITPALSEAISFWANAVVFVGLAVLVLLGMTPLAAVIDATLGNIATFLTDILVIIGGVAGFAAGHQLSGHFTRGFAFQYVKHQEAYKLLNPGKK